MPCVVCGHVMDNWIDGDIWRCGNCGHWSSSFPATPRNGQSVDLDEGHRHSALQELRLSNALTILDEIASHVEVESPTLCDVGTAYGWFVSLAQKAGFKSLGIEPDHDVAQIAIEQGLPIRIGEFPRCLETSEQFDVLTFNDVFEHLSEPGQILSACRRHLKARGLLVMVLPSDRGVLFRIAYQLRRLGIRGPWDRLWQRTFPCPHRHYYSPNGLKRLLEKAGFQFEAGMELPSFHYRGLWNRVKMDYGVSFPRAALSYVSLILISPVLRAGRSDIAMQIYRCSGLAKPEIELRTQSKSD
jgi:SAM-dependent methyltransferase